MQTALADTDRELANLVRALATGGESTTLVQAVKERERERDRLDRELTAVDALAALGDVDCDDLRRRVEAQLGDWQGLLGRHVQQARQILAKALDERLVFTPETGPDGAPFYRFTGTGRLDPVLGGLLPLPRALVTPAGFARR